MMMMLGWSVITFILLHVITTFITDVWSVHYVIIVENVMVKRIRISLLDSFRKSRVITGTFVIKSASAVVVEETGIKIGFVLSPTTDGQGFCRSWILFGFDAREDIVDGLGRSLVHNDVADVIAELALFGVDGERFGSL